MDNLSHNSQGNTSVIEAGAPQHGGAAPVPISAWEGRGTGAVDS